MSQPTIIGHPPPPGGAEVDFDDDKTHTRPGESAKGLRAAAHASGDDDPATHRPGSGAPPPDLEDLPTRAMPFRAEHPSTSSVTPAGLARSRDDFPEKEDAYPPERKGKRWLVVAAAFMVVFLGGLLWIRMTPEQVTTQQVPAQAGVTQGPAVTPPTTTAPTPATTKVAEPVVTAEPTAEPAASAAPVASVEPTAARPNQGGGRPPRPPSTGAAPTGRDPTPPPTSKPTADPVKPPDDDLTSPYR